MKFCKDCKWWVQVTKEVNVENLDKCMEPSRQESKGISMVTGEPYPPKTIWAESERKYGKCGEEATLFQPKEVAIE